MSVNKITWAQVGRVTEPGRYLFKFGWLTITAEDLAIWEEFPNAAFTLYSAAAGTTAEPGGETEEETGEEFRLVTFELWQNILLSEKGGPTQRPPSGGPFVSGGSLTFQSGRSDATICPDVTCEAAVPQIKERISRQVIHRPGH